VPRGIAVDDAGNIYVAEEAGSRIRRIDPSGVITTIAGNGQTKPQGHNPRIAGDPGPAPAMEAQFDTLHDLNIDGKGDVWIADSKNNRIRVVSDPGHAPAGNPGSAPAQSQPPPPPPTTTSTAPPDATTTTTAPPEPQEASTTTTTTPPPAASNGSKKSPGPTTNTTTSSGKQAPAHKQAGPKHH